MHSDASLSFDVTATFCLDRKVEPLDYYRIKYRAGLFVVTRWRASGAPASRPVIGLQDVAQPPDWFSHSACGFTSVLFPFGQLFMASWSTFKYSLAEECNNFTPTVPF